MYDDGEEVPREWNIHADKAWLPLISERETDGKYLVCGVCQEFDQNDKKIGVVRSPVENSGGPTSKIIVILIGMQ